MKKHRLIEKKESNIDVIKRTLVCITNKGNEAVGVDYFSKRYFDEYILKEVIDLKQNYSDEYKLLDYWNDAELPIPGGYHSYREEQCHTLKEMTIEYVGENGKVYDVVLD